MREHDGYRAIQGLPGVGQILAAIFVAEIDVATRFAGPERFVHMARMDTTAPRIRHRGNCGQSTKQGSKLVRWATVEAIQRKTTAQIAADRLRVEARRGESIAEIDAARKLLAVVYCGLRDGEISALAKERGGAWSSSKSHPYLGVVAHLIDAA